MNRTWPVTAALLGGFWGGCQHPAAPHAAAGRSTFAFVDPPPPTDQPSAAKVEVSEEPERYRPPVVVSDLVAPAYPASALAGHAGAATVNVQLTVGISGRITDVSPNAVDLAVLGWFAPAFQDAIEAAVAQWRFLPAGLVHTERGTDPRHSYLRITGTELVPAQLEVKFRFTADGKVSVKDSGR